MSQQKTDQKRRLPRAIAPTRDYSPRLSLTRQDRLGEPPCILPGMTAPSRKRRRPDLRPVGTRVRVTAADAPEGTSRFLERDEVNLAGLLALLRDRAVVAVEAQDGTTLTATPSLAEAEDNDPEGADWDAATLSFTTFVFDPERSMVRQGFMLAPVEEVPVWDMSSAARVLYGFYHRGELHPHLIEWLHPVDADGEVDA